MVKKHIFSFITFTLFTLHAFAFEHEKLDDVIQNGKFQFIITMLAPPIEDKPAMPIGAIEVYDSKFGLILVPKLSTIPPGAHGFHIHQNPSCNNSETEDNSIIIFGAAGGHFDPKKREKHLGPYGRGHLGDLPALIISKDPSNSIPILAPRLSSKDILGHSIIIHDNSDNYSDFPKKLGGGGTRIACGVITKN